MRMRLIVIAIVILTCANMMGSVIEHKVAESRRHCAAMLESVITDMDTVRYDRKCGRVGVYYTTR